MSATSNSQTPVYMGLPSAKVLRPRLALAASLSLPLMLLSMGGMLPGMEGLEHAAWNGWVQFSLATPVFFWCGWFFLRRWWLSIRNRDSNMFTLIVTGTGAAWGYSTVALICGDALPEALRGMHGKAPLYFEACAITTTIVLLGQILEQRAQAGTEAALHSLMALVPSKARRIRLDGTEEEIAAKEIHIGDLLCLRPGDAVPVDGLVTGGSSEIDEAMLTGEPMPVAKGPGDYVRAGTQNTTGALHIRATQIGDSTVLARIIRMVEEAQESEAPIQRLADKAAGVFVPIVGSIAVVTFVAWLFFGPEPRLIHGLVSAMAVLVISCPCTLGLATPVAVVTGIGRGARGGILFRNAEALEHMAKTTVLFVDKTGTLTKGHPCVTGIQPSDGIDEAELLATAAAIEKHSEHPIARAILEEAQRRNLTIEGCTDFRALPGVGVEARLANGSLAKAVRADRHSPDTAPQIPSEASTLVEVLINGNHLGRITLKDELRPEAALIVNQLRAQELKLIILSGDRTEAVKAVADSLGIDEYHAALSPADKQALVTQARQHGHVVAFAGDGINDAPSLASADVGIAMGSGTDIAQASAGVILMNGDLGALVRLRSLSTATLAIIRQNLVWAFLYNGLCIPLAAGAFWPMFGWQLSPMIAGAAMCLSSLCVVTNALRLRKIPLTTPGNP